MKIITKLWIKYAIVRAIKTMAQTAAAVIGTQAAGILEVDWIGVLSASLLAGILSLLTSLGGLPEVDLQSTFQLIDDTEPMEIDAGEFEEDDFEDEEEVI